MEQINKKLVYFFILPLFGIFVLSAVAYRQTVPDFLLKINFYDVGQGDTIFIQTYLGNQVLIDGGPGNQVLQELGTEMPFWDRQIELVMLTHPHADHVSGLIEVLKRYKVKKVIMPEVDFDSPPYFEFLRLIGEKGIEKAYVHEGQRIYLDNATVFDIYYPPQGKFIADNDYDGFAGNRRNPNDVSIVGKLTFGKTKILFTGDVGEEIEKMLLPKYDLDSDVLKVGHHGSRFSSSLEFLQEVTPAFSVIEVGKNSYGHPTQAVIDRIKTVNSQILRTDQDQTIRFKSDGVSIFR